VLFALTYSRVKTLFIGIAAAVALVVMTSVHLDYQGFYYDELHQAPTAFRYLGRHPKMFTAEFNDIPILNMTYRGAIKSHIYGIYLRYIGHRFSVYSWRLLGILFVATGLCIFSAVAARFLSPAAAALFALLLLTDATVIVTTRHDWGPTALGLALRLIFAATWFSLDLGEITARHYFLAGMVVGVAVFEKLVAVVLFGPLLVLLIGGGRLNRRLIAAACGGGFLGTFPIAYANYSSYRHGRGLVSLSDVAARTSLGLRDFAQFLLHYLALGRGEGAAAHVLGAPPQGAWPLVEAFVLLSALVIVCIGARRHRHSNRSMTLAWKMAAAYLFVGILMYLLPHETNFYHWIQGTPFQYAAVALAWDGLQNSRRLQALVLAAVSVVVGGRIPNVIGIESALAKGTASIGFAPSFTRLGEFAAAKANDAIFIAADWGTGTQIYCLSNGDDNLVYETFWADDPVREARAVTEAVPKNTLYVVRSHVSPQFDGAADSVLDWMSRSADWREEPVEEEMRLVAPIEVRKFVRRSRNRS
jgi:hypothetical protein